VNRAQDYKVDRKTKMFCSKDRTSRSLFGDGRYPHMPIVCVASADDYGSHSNSELHFLVDGRFVRFWASGGAKFPKMKDSLLRTPMNHRAKFDTASFILAKEIRNCTNKQTNNKTNEQTVNDISAPCLSACVDNKLAEDISRSNDNVRIEDG